MNVNPDLVAIYRKHLLSQFGAHDTRTRSYKNQLVTEAYDPWWWPMYPAARPSDWGLDQSHLAEFASVAPEPSASRWPYRDFGGSVSATPGCIFVVGERPSFNRHFGKAVSSLWSCLLNFIDEGHIFHVTDSVKFRGENLTDKLSADMLQISAACLADEIALLQPSAVLFTSLTLRALRKLEGQVRFPEITASLINHPRQETVPFWSGDALATWQAALHRLTK